jgi:hypothetical protein
MVVSVVEKFLRVIEPVVGVVAVLVNLASG